MDGKGREICVQSEMLLTNFEMAPKSGEVAIKNEVTSGRLFKILVSNN